MPFGTPSFHKSNSLFIIISVGNCIIVNFIRFNSLVVRAWNEKKRWNSTTCIVIAQNLMTRTDLIILMQLIARFGSLYEEHSLQILLSFLLIFFLLTFFRCERYDGMYLSIQSQHEHCNHNIWQCIKNAVAKKKN